MSSVQGPALKVVLVDVNRAVTAAWEADAPLDVVTAYYVERLDQGSWQITGKNTVDGTWEFRHTDGKIHGYIQLSGHGQQTRVDVLLLK